MAIEIDPELLQGVMAECRIDCPGLPEYFVWVNSVDLIMQNMGYDGNNDDADVLYKNAKEELNKTSYEFTVI